MTGEAVLLCISTVAVEGDAEDGVEDVGVLIPSNSSCICVTASAGACLCRMRCPCRRAILRLRPEA